jgi:hypothetical protein
MLFAEERNGAAIHPAVFCLFLVDFEVMWLELLQQRSPALRLSS